MENYWISQNKEKFEYVNEYLPTFLKQRPNLTSAISQAENRYEEAYNLMTALTPKQQADVKKAALPKRDAPNNPAGVPKSTVMQQHEDVMNMSDSEFAQWRAKARRR